MDGVFYQMVFYLFAALTVGSALVVVASRNIVHSAFALLFTFFGVAGLYVFLSADFLAATQLLIYVGGILVLILFGVMLTRKVFDVKIFGGKGQVYPAAVGVALIFSLLIIVIMKTPWHLMGGRAMEPTTAEIGKMLMTDFLLPFEVASVLLLAALIGAVILIRKEVRPTKEN